MTIYCTSGMESRDRREFWSKENPSPLLWLHSFLGQYMVYISNELGALSELYRSKETLSTILAQTWVLALKQKFSTKREKSQDRLPTLNSDWPATLLLATDTSNIPRQVSRLRLATGQQWLYIELIPSVVIALMTYDSPIDSASFTELPRV